MTDVTIKTPTHQLRSYLARPEGEGSWPGVIVLHDAAGMSNDLRHQADWLASAGYLTVAPDLYSWGRKIVCIWAIMRELAAGRGQVFADIDATRQWIAVQPGCTGRVGVIGFCMGGGFALMLAPGHGFEAASVNYSGKDWSQRGAANRLERALDVLGIDHDVKEYPNAGHSFLNDHHNMLFKILGLIGIAYHEPSAQDARQRILSFFERHLQS